MITYLLTNMIVWKILDPDCKSYEWYSQNQLTANKYRNRCLEAALESEQIQFSSK